MTPAIDGPSPPADVDAVVEDEDDSEANSPTTLNDVASERGGNASTTWASTSFDDDDVDRIADNLSAEEIQMFEQVSKSSDLTRSPIVKSYLTVLHHFDSFFKNDTGFCFH